jgi:glycosyltransferase involved in cell wall biosynthesis
MKGIPFYYWMSYPLPEGQIALARERGLSAGFAKFLLPWLRGQIGQRLLNKVVLRHADHIFVQSDYMMRDLEKKGVPKSRMTAVPMGVDLQALSTHPVLPVDDHRLQGRRVLVYLGTLNRPRRIEVLFEMLALMRRAKIDAVLVLVGDTDDPVHRQWLQRRARESGVEHCVVWTGWLPTLEAWRYVRRADVALSPIPRGTLLDVSSPTKLPEYLALGVPVVCNDNPDQKAIMDSTGSGKCVPYTAHEFASAAIELLSLDEETRACMIRRGQRFVEERRSYRLLAKVLAERYASLSEQRTEGRPTSLPT